MARRKKKTKPFFSSQVVRQNNPRTYEGGRGSRVRFILEDKTSVPDVFTSCSFIPRVHFETSLVMVSCYGYDIWCHKEWVVKPILGENTCLQLFSTIKVNFVAKIMQSAYLCVIFHVKHKKWPFLAVLTWFLILGKIRDGGQDDDHSWWRHRPPAAPPPLKYTSSCQEDWRFSTKVKIVVKNSGNGFHPPLDCTTVGV